VKTTYLDNDVICGIVKQDLEPKENEAVVGLLRLRDQGAIRLVSSEVTKQELARWKGEKRQDAEAEYENLEKVEYILDHRLIGFNNQWSRQGGWSSPMIEDDPLAAALWKLGLRRTDSHHLMLAIREKCHYFVTCDRKTILSRRRAIEAAFSDIRLLSPAELLAELSVTKS
jgi:hypothetical protein